MKKEDLELLVKLQREYDDLNSMVSCTKSDGGFAVSVVFDGYGNEWLYSRLDTEVADKLTETVLEAYKDKLKQLKEEIDSYIISKTI